MRRNAKGGIGDGDVCPVVPAHGNMLVLGSGKTQYCSHQTHDGRSGKAGFPATRKFWPYQFFAAEVERWRTMTRTAGEAAAAAVLPDIDMEAFNA